MPNLPRLFRPPHLGPRKEVTREREARRTRSRAGAFENTAAWQKLRQHWRNQAENALCVCCKANGITKVAVLVDHVIPHDEDRALGLDPDNLQSLCKQCHDQIKRTVEQAWRDGKASAAELRLDRLFPEQFGG